MTGMEEGLRKLRELRNGHGQTVPNGHRDYPHPRKVNKSVLSVREIARSALPFRKASELIDAIP